MIPYTQSPHTAQKTQHHATKTSKKSHGIWEEVLWKLGYALPLHGCRPVSVLPGLMIHDYGA
jgi:hypothetical protein